MKVVSDYEYGIMSDLVEVVKALTNPENHDGLNHAHRNGLCILAFRQMLSLENMLDGLNDIPQPDPSKDLPNPVKNDIPF